ncbi:MAG: 8-oxo-dGTP diphosphatase MutT [Bacillota bacterium]
MTTLRVAIGVVQVNGRILICRRPITTRLGGYWEFPGGKCEPDESPVDCLRRELQEEVGLIVEPTQALAVIDYHYPNGPIRLYPFLCRVLSGKATALAADELRWVTAKELFDYRFPPANDQLLQLLASQAQS